MQRNGVSALEIRKLPWQFDETTPFLWNRANPQFSLVMNGLSFIAPGFEKFIVSATRAAIPKITDPAARDETEAFLRQEALHARAHRAHTAALIGRYPGLQNTLDEIEARFDRLLARPLEFQLAYVADIEATFTPLFDLILRHRDVLFDNGDHRVAPLFMWHLVEEVEFAAEWVAAYDNGRDVVHWYDESAAS
jgi:predicted metal-dependent hydrolase